jgi:hypothetical protein
LYWNNEMCGKIKQNTLHVCVCVCVCLF